MHWLPENHRYKYWYHSWNGRMAFYHIPCFNCSHIVAKQYTKHTHTPVLVLSCCKQHSHFSKYLFFHLNKWYESFNFCSFILPITSKPMLSISWIRSKYIFTSNTLWKAFTVRAYIYIICTLCSKHCLFMIYRLKNIYRNMIDKG